MWVVYPVTFLEGALYAFLYPAEHPLLPRLVADGRLITANALNSLNDNLARIIEPMIGGVILARADLGVAVLVDEASYFLAAMLIAGISTPGRVEIAPAVDEAPVDQVMAPWARAWREWVEGMQLICTTPLLRGLFLVIAMGALGDSLNTPLIVPFILIVVGAGAAGIGLMFTARGVAGLLGGLLIGRFGPRFNSVALLGWSLITTGIGWLIIVNVPMLSVLVVVQLILAPATIGWPTSQQTLLQSASEDRFRGRIFGSLDTTIAVAGIIGIAIGSALGDIVGVVPIFNLSALLYATAGVVALSYLRRMTSRPARHLFRETAV